MTRAARRLVLAPAAPLEPATAEAAAVALAERPPDGVVRVGQLVPAGDVKLVAWAVDPPLATRVGRETEVRLDLAPPPAPSAEAFDVAILLDHGGAMRRPLAEARAAVERLLANGSDVVRNVALLGFAEEPFRAAPPAVLAAARVTAYDAYMAKGKSRLLPAIDFALADLLRAPPGPRRAVVVLTAGDGARDGAEAAQLADAGRRAARVGLVLHALDLGPTPTPGLAEAVAAAKGTYTRDAALGLRPILEAMARDAGVPLEWRGAPPPGEEVEFEIVVRAIPPDPPGFPKIPRKRRK